MENVRERVQGTCPVRQVLHALPGAPLHSKRLLTQFWQDYNIEMSPS